MGLRLWIETKYTPEFPDRVQWQFLNQQLEIDNHMYWFFQDEWDDDCALYRCAGLDRNEPHGLLQKMYYKKHMELIEKLIAVTNEDINNYFNNAWERPLPYWDMYRTITIAYIEAKRDYLKALHAASIINTKSAFDVDELLNSDIPAWYEYRYTGPAKVLPRIPGKVTKI
jgi:hypothetical protein